MNQIWHETALHLLIDENQKGLMRNSDIQHDLSQGQESWPDSALPTT